MTISLVVSDYYATNRSDVPGFIAYLIMLTIGLDAHFAHFGTNIIKKPYTPLYVEF